MSILANRRFPPILPFRPPDVVSLTTRFQGLPATVKATSIQNGCGFPSAPAIFLTPSEPFPGTALQVRLARQERLSSILGFPEAHDPDVVYLENQAGSIYVEEAGETERYSQMFNHLIAKALSLKER